MAVTPPRSMSINNCFHLLLREALLTSVRTVKTGMLVCVESNCFFAKRISGGNHVPVGKGVLNDRFLGFEKFLKSFEKF